MPLTTTLIQKFPNMRRCISKLDMRTTIQIHVNATNMAINFDSALSISQDIVLSYALSLAIWR